jgi:HAMP domain-containing protein
MADKVQSFSNHAQIVPMYHYVTLGLLQLTFIGACVNLYQSWDDHARLYSASLIVTLTLATLLLALYARFFALKAQDRAIRAEEQLRHYVITGKLLDPRLTMRQIIGLRFASNDEFVALAQRAAETGLPAKEIKQAVRNWRADTDRV